MMDESRPLSMFRCEQIESSKLAKEWMEWKLALEYYFDSYQITDQKLMRSKMLHLGGPQLQKVFRNLEGTEDFPMVLLEKPWYNHAVNKLDSYFKPRRQNVLERHKLRNIKQGQQLSDCGLEKHSREVRCVLEEIMLTDVIIEGCTSQELRRKILEKDQSVADIEALGESLESVRIQEKEMTSNSSSHGDAGTLVVRKVQRFVSGKAERKQDRVINRYFGKTSTNGSGNESRTLCYACGKFGHISKAENCPAKGQKCRRCQIVGHFEKVCRKRHMQHQRTDTSKVRAIDVEVEATSHEKEVSDDCPDKKVYYTFHTGNRTNEIKCRIGRVPVVMFVDSGSDVNLVTAESWEMLKVSNVIIHKCTKGSKKILKAYGSNEPLEILGTFEATVEVDERHVDAEFFVTAKGQRNLLGDATSKQLGVLKIGLEVKQVVSGINAPFQKIKGVLVHIEMDPKVNPIYQPLRRIPIAQENAVNRKLDDLLARGEERPCHLGIPISSRK
ncbi:uncharacterized protein LOC129763570 [Toxorhynchites rutilus septentrionalis]|uniref:uncharacterized protein LOC129763570 n=1 Tax=Toxorhynchites rutilus septentrionalis TaxID=329112 RepID=UPI002479E08A|nr:uncharacterized protein LOC129763570 [Toxorhynchites rutilus septentrionalis]